MSKTIWYNREVCYIGATGVNSVEEMAALALEEGNEHIIDLFDFDPEVELTVSDVARALAGVEATVIPAAHLHRERWDSGNSWTVALDAKPGRGYVKVLGVMW